MVIMKQHFLVIAGCGTGSPDFISPEIITAVEWAEVLVGDQRLLDLFPESPAEKIAVGESINDVIREIDKRRTIKRIVVLVAGDPSLSPLTDPLVRHFGSDTCKFIPAQ